MYVVDIFFFNQKTAYEVRISDWSSDVCSSDLTAACRSGARCGRSGSAAPSQTRGYPRNHLRARSPGSVHCRARACQKPARLRARHRHRASTSARRSEEHTSELQSLMRISYAVFCLKKKTNTTHKHTNAHTI